MKLTKAQIAAIVDEVSEQLNTKESTENISLKIRNDWEKLKVLLEEKREIYRAKDALYEKYLEADRAYDEYVCDLEGKVRSFEKKHDVNVDWDDDEDPKFLVNVRNMSDKIERQITLLTIDTKEKITSDMLIEKMIEKFSKV